MSGDFPDPPSKLRFLFTICFVFFGDFAARSFFLVLTLSLVETILPVVTRALLFLTLLEAERSICREVRLVSKLFGRLRNDLERLTLLLPGLLGRMVGAGGCIELAEAGRPTEPLEDLTLLGWTEPSGARMLRR